MALGSPGRIPAGQRLHQSGSAHPLRHKTQAVDKFGRIGSYNVSIRAANSHSPRPLLTENRLWMNYAILGQDAIPGQSPPLYLDRPLIPLAVALPRMLAKIEADLSTAGPAEMHLLHQRAELLRRLLTPR
jgi:hypothetical protein